MNTYYLPAQLTDEELVKQLPGFTNGYAEANNTRLHYVQGGTGEPLVLLPGWPQTWWAYHKIMPLLAAHYHVIAVDIRGMGSSAKPEAGYNKKNMARDIYELIQVLGYERVIIAGHDIGAGVAYSFATQFPQAAAKLMLLDTPPLDENVYRLPMLPASGTNTQKADGDVYPWWMAFNQVAHLPEQLLAGRVHLLHDYIFSYVSVDESAISPFDRAVYAAAYDTAEGIRAGNAWYQAFPQDVIDNKTYPKLTLPVIGIGGSGYEMLQLSLPNISTKVKLAHVDGSGHFFFEEQPHSAAELMISLLQA